MRFWQFCDDVLQQIGWLVCFLLAHLLSPFRFLPSSPPLFGVLFISQLFALSPPPPPSPSPSAYPSPSLVSPPFLSSYPAGYPSPLLPSPRIQQVRDALVQERERLASLLTDIPFLSPYPSSSNFILCSVVGDKWSAGDLKVGEAPLKLRHFSFPLHSHHRYACMCGCHGHAVISSVSFICICSSSSLPFISG